MAEKDEDIESVNILNQEEIPTDDNADEGEIEEVIAGQAPVGNHRRECSLHGTPRNQRGVA